MTISICFNNNSAGKCLKLNFYMITDFILTEALVLLHVMAKCDMSRYIVPVNYRYFLLYYHYLMVAFVETQHSVKHTRLLQRHGRVFACRSSSPGIRYESQIGRFDFFSAPCDIWWPVWGLLVFQTSIWKCSGIM